VDASALEEVFEVRAIIIRTWEGRSRMLGKKLHERIMGEVELAHVQLDELWATVNEGSLDIGCWGEICVITKLMPVAHK
jgi:hypothetical protein